MRAAAWLPEEATVDPRLLTDATLEAAGQRGAEIRVGCAVTSLLRDGDRCTGVIAGGERIAAHHVIVAAGCYSRGIADERENNWLAHYVPTNPVRGQMVALQPSDFRLRRVLRSDSGYVVPRRDGRVVAGSTLEDAGFRKHVTAAGLRQILAAAVEMVPALAGAEVVETWAGLRPGTPDNLPILGPIGCRRIADCDRALPEWNPACPRHRETRSRMDHARAKHRSMRGFFRRCDLPKESRTHPPEEELPLAPETMAS